MKRAQSGSADTAGQILDAAERLVQINGFNGFSYADIAAELALTKAALHYHFSGKSDLGRALIDRYADRFAAALARIDREEPGAPEKLRAYASLYGEVLRADRMCLCGMLAAEYRTLPEPMREAVIGFFDASETWLAWVLKSGVEAGSLSFTGSAEETARMLVGALEGAMLVARPYRDVARFEATAHQLLATLESGPAG